MHGFIASADGQWCVIQQGLNESLREARRYHWQSESLTGFFESPHAAIAGRNAGAIVNLADARARRSRAAALELAHSGPGVTVSVLKRLRRGGAAASPLPEQQSLGLDAEPQPLSAPPHLQLPHHHEVTFSDVLLRRLHATLAAAAERGPIDFADLLLMEGVGTRTVTALALVAEVIHGAPSRCSDPARFSFAHGGKDGHPFPVPLHVYDQTIEVLKRAVHRAKLDRSDTLFALRRLDSQARELERLAQGPPFAELIAAGKGVLVAVRRPQCLT
jgi:uncharacterized protein